jgi:virulence-associated protein VagC
VVDEGRQRVVDPAGERIDDCALDLLEPVDEKERAKRCLE